MQTSASSADATAVLGRPRSALLEQLGAVLERRAARLALVGALLIASTLLALSPSPLAGYSGWLFMIPIAIAAVCAGIGEGVVVALVASVTAALLAEAASGGGFPEFLGVLSARFALYGMAGAGLGAAAETRLSVRRSLRLMASTDSLSQIPGVTSYFERFSSLEAQGALLTVLVVDVDDLEGLNGEHGYDAGTEAIGSVANCLRWVVRMSDHVARYGGDEFVVLLQDADRAGAKIVIDRLGDVLSRETIPGAAEPGITVSAGIAVRGEDGVTAQELLAAADVAMYEQKRATKA